jgi:hypothetical protein
MGNTAGSVFFRAAYRIIQVSGPAASERWLSRQLALHSEKRGPAPFRT